jgi:hypothetical protein
MQYIEEFENRGGLMHGQMPPIGMMGIIYETNRDHENVEGSYNEEIEEYPTSPGHA